MWIVLKNGRTTSNSKSNKEEYFVFFVDMNRKKEHHIGLLKFIRIYLRKSSTHTVPSDALAPTRVPRLFQQTPKIPPVPR
jgi:hypothetical protein